MIVSLRMFVLFCSFFILVGCDGDNSATVRFKVIAVLEVDDEIKEFSNVRQVKYTRYDKPSGLGFGGKTKAWGEALTINLGDRGTAYLLGMRFANRQYFTVYETGLLNTFNIPSSVGSLDDDDLEKLRSLSGRKRLINQNHKGRDVQPSFVAFKDDADPNSIFLLREDEFENYFGNEVRLIGIDLEITNKVITSDELIKSLPWLSKKKNIGFERQPPGPSRLLGDKPRPLSWYMSYRIFYAEGSR